MAHRCKQGGLWTILCLLCFTVPVFAGGLHAAQSSEQALQDALQQAEQRQLASDDTWLALLHYKRETLLRRFISQVDDQRFFLDENGKVDAKAELLADIRAFFSDEPVSPAQEGNEQNEKGRAGVHAQCLFPARWWWLKQQLTISDEFDVPCPELDDFIRRMAHDKLFLVFPSMYLNNPGSTFGHTFLRFDDEDGPVLLSQTLNYAARVDRTDSIMSYVSKGLFGGYQGFFRARHYFETVQEYNNIENRDIWEYQLRFSKAEIKQLVRHVWEVKGIDFDYYFFRENCAYRLLALLDVVRPGLQLTGEGEFSFYAIPVDTVRALDEKNLVESRVFRASLATQIEDYHTSNSRVQSSLALEVAKLKSTGKLHADSALVSKKLQGLDTPAEQLAVLQQSFKILEFSGRSSTSLAQAVLFLINETSSSDTTPNDALSPVQAATDKPAADTESSSLSATISPARTSPERGHESVRTTAGVGQQNGLSYIDIKFRLAFHDLLDDPDGYVAGAAINVFDSHLKWFTGRDTAAGSGGSELRVESLSLFNVTSLSPLSAWQKPVSWMFDFRFDRTQLSRSDSARNFISRGGAGFSLRKHGFTPYALVMGEWNVASAYDKGYSILLGLQAGIQLMLPANQLMLSYQADRAVSGFDLDRKEGRFQWQYNIQVNHAFRLSYRRMQYHFYDDEDWSLDYHYYF